MEGVALEALIERRETPFFLFSERRLVANYQALAAGLASAGGDVTLRYCAKANSEAGVLAVLAREGSALLASHLAEVELALACGFPPSRVAYQRPAPPAAEIEAVLDAGVRLLHVLRPEDVDLFRRQAERRGLTLRLSLRLREEGGLLRSPFARLNARLGLSAPEARAVAAACRDRGGLEVAALNLYAGTQRAGARGFDRGLRHACALARDWAVEGVAEIEEINLGGGVPSPSLRRLSPRHLWARWRDRPNAAPGGDGALDGGATARLEAFARRLAERYRAIAARTGLARVPALAAEPGRAIVGNAGVLVSRVAAVGEGWVFLDASRNFLGESPLLFRRAILAVRPGGETARFVHLSGNTLNTMDVIDVRRRLPALRVGDALAFCDAGAYSISRASRYAGLSPAVWLLDRAGAVRAIRRAEDARDLMGPMAPAWALPAARE